MADVLYGRNAVREALRAGRRTFQRLTVSSGAQEAGTLGEIIKLADKAEVAIARVDRHELDRKLRDANHQGVMLECGDYPYAELSDCLDLAAERQAFALLFATDDKREGVQAFLDKRPPVWTGK